MSKLFVLLVVLVAFVGVIFANHLECLTCSTPATCKKPTPQKCNVTMAKESSRELTTIFSNVSPISSENFECVDLKLKNASSKNVSNEIRGCVFRELNVCHLALNANQTEIFKYCLVCDEDKCNSAGAFNGSVYTMLASAVALLLAKFLS